MTIREIADKVSAISPYAEVIQYREYPDHIELDILVDKAHHSSAYIANHSSRIVRARHSSAVGKTVALTYFEAKEMTASEIAWELQSLVSEVDLVIRSHKEIGGLYGRLHVRIELLNGLYDWDARDAVHAKAYELETQTGRSIICDFFVDEQGTFL